MPGSSFPVGTITNSFATGAASGGAGSTVDPFIALVDPTTAANPPTFPSTIAGCTDPTCVFVVTGVLPSSANYRHYAAVDAIATAAYHHRQRPCRSTPPPLLSFSPELLTSLAAQQAQVIQNLTSVVQLAALSTPPVVSNVQGAIRTPPQPPPQPPTTLLADGRSCRVSSAGSWIFRRPPKPA